MIPDSTRLNIRRALANADTDWAHAHSAGQIEPGRMVALVEAVERHIGSTAVEQLRLDLANARAVIGRLVEAIRGEWDPAKDPHTQIRAALDELKQVERFLLSLDQTKIVKHRAGDRETSKPDGLEASPIEKGVA